MHTANGMSERYQIYDAREQGPLGRVRQTLLLIRPRPEVALGVSVLFRLKQTHFRNTSCSKAKIEPVDLSWVPHAAERVVAERLKTAACRRPPRQARRR